MLGSTKLRVLVATDDRRVAAGFRDQLLDLGHDPVVVSSAEEALRALATDRLDAIVLDIVFNGEFLPDRVFAFYSFGYRAAHRFRSAALHGQRPRARAPENFWRAFFTGARRADRKT